MYFSVKAFKGTKRRFENLDNWDELMDFIETFIVEKGFNKMIVKSFDQNGFRKRNFYVYSENSIQKFLNK